MGEALGVSGKTYEKAKKVTEAAVPKLVEMMNAEEVSIDAAAEVAKLPPNEQQQTVKKGAKAVKEKAKQLKKEKKSPEPVNQPEPEHADDTEQPPTPAEEDPSDVFTETLNTLCRELDGIGQRVAAIKESPYGRFVHWQSAQVQIKNGRETLWQGRPTHQCPYCRVAGEVQPNCRCCGGLNVCTKQSYKAGVAAVGGAD